MRRQKSQAKSQTRSAKRRRDTESPDEVQSPQIQPISSAKATRSRSKHSQIQTQNQVVFQKGSYVAFVDPSDTNNFRIGFLLQDLKEDDEEAVLDIYQEMAPLVYHKSASKQPVPEYTIICDVNATPEKPQGRGAKPQLKINKQQKNKATKLMDNVVKIIEQERLDNEEEEDESEEESDEEEEEESPPPKQKGKRESSSDIKNRRILKSKSQSQSQNRQASQKSTQAAKKSTVASARKAVTSKSVAKKGQDEEMKSEDEEESKELIDTSKKRSQSKKKTEKLPVVGQKRLRTVKKPKKDEEDEEEQDNEDSFVDDEDSQVVKKRKMSKGKEKVVKEKKPKAKKMPTVFKKGKWNPDITLVEKDIFMEGESTDLFLNCCIRCNNKNIIRAAVLGDERLLKKGIDAKQKISQMTAFWSPELKTTPLEIMISSNNHQMLETLLHPKVKIPQHSTYEQERDRFFLDRVQNPQYLMNFVDSGMVSHMAYGSRVRKVQMTRGNRQGNNAFLEYHDNHQRNPVYQLSDEILIKKLFYFPEIEYETYKQLYKLYPNIENVIQSYVFEAVRAGNRKIAHEMIKNMVKYPNFGFNQLHCDVLSTDAEPEKILKQSITKKANTNRDITPLHCACINPNPKYLRMLLDLGPDLNTVDTDLRRPIHYAAACEGPEPLQLLIQAGATLPDQDNQKNNCLHIACMTGRAHNVRLIIQSAPQLINLKNKKGMTPMAYACKYGHTEVVKVLLENKVRINSGCGFIRMPPLAWAAAYGHYDLALYLLDNKGRVLGKDKFQRTPLIMACRNGHAKIASLLLQRGAEWNHQDSSKNTPLHYAAAYGWLDCIELLLKAGADVNAQNSWKISPINIAMLKSHQGCVKRLLEEPNVDVNGKDDKGRTLIMLSMFVLDEGSVDFISFLLRKGADPNIGDLEGQTALHYIAKYQPQNIMENGKVSKVLYQKQIDIQKQVTQILIQNNADLTIKDSQKRTPFTLCLDNDNVQLLEFLQDKVSINKEPELFFSFKSKIFNEQYQRILRKIILNDPPTKETINTLNSAGYTPFLYYLQAFTEQFMPTFFTGIKNRINQQAYLHAEKFDRYKITNEDLFDKFADTSNYYNYNMNITELQKNELTLKFLREIITLPFIKMLQFLVDHGADVHSQVGKLKKYRDLELLKSQQFAQLAEGEDIKMEKEEHVKKREEKLDEMNRRKKGNYLRIAKHGYPNGLQSTQLNNDNEKDVYEMIGGKKVLREYGSDGLRNGIHLIIKNAVPDLLEYLLKLKINPDQPDYDENTPFNLLSHNDSNGSIQQIFDYTFDKLLDIEIRIDHPNIKGRTPFLNYYDQQKNNLAYRMLDMGANVNQMDNGGLFALKYALIRRQNKAIEELLERGANINQIDNKGRNLLHHAINMSSATADATFETEQFLLERGVEINLRDHKNRTPLHYAFVKIQNWKDNTQIDPIETVSSICGFKGLELDVPDKWLKTPLHYASQRGASICAMYLIQRGADMEKKDIYGNTPLGVSLMNKHYNYGIILIQKLASVKPLIYHEDPDRIQKMWKEEEEKQKALHKQSQKGRHTQQDEVMDESVVDTSEKKVKKHRNLFKRQHGYDDYDDEYDDEDESEEDEDDQYHETVFNKQNAFGMNVYATRGKVNRQNFGQVLGGWNNPWGQPAQALNHNQVGADLISKDDKEGVSMFKMAIRGGQQGLAYLMLDNGYDLMLAMQDAMDEKKFMLVLTLLSKNPNDEIVQQKNNKGQNLFHILSMNASGCGLEHLQRIYEALKKRGVDCQAKDNFGRNALHYAVISGSLALVKLLLGSNEGYNPNEVDHEGHTPLSLCLRGKSGGQMFYNPTLQIDNIFLSLVKSGADVNFVYPEDSYKPAFKDEDLVDMDSYDPNGKYMCTALINTIRQEPNNEILRSNIIGLIEYGAKLNFYDSDGRDAIMHAIIGNNTMVIEILLENNKALNINVNHQDKNGKSAVHYVVNPLKYGSFENVQILKFLNQYKFNFRLKDAQNKEPVQYAAEQESGVLLKEIARYIGHQQDLEKFNRQLSMIESQKWPEPRVDFENDAEEYMDLAQERERRLAKEKDERVPVDQTGKFEKSYQVYYEEEKPWDVYLTKVDLKNGIYGDYVFYKMQLLYDTNRDLYVVFTRWGRIGETGMNQRTPFNDLEEAKSEFKKIFKQKTGGNNFEELDKFSRVKKKYNLTRVNYITVNFKDFLQPFDYDKCPKSLLSKPLYDLFEEISNVTMYQRAMNQFGLDTDVMPFSGVKKDSLVEARQVLMEIQETIKEDQELSKEGIKADFDKLVQIKERISELSSRYYELIPQTRYKNQIAPPLNNMHMIKTQYDTLDGLTNIEYASKMLLAALLKQQEMNPVDYIYHALNLMIEPLETESPEYEVIRKYIDNTRNADGYQHGHMGDYEISHIFKFQRKGEAEMIQAFKEVPNHFLLFHGSAMYNFMGILSQGLRIAPPEAPPTGYMFGKGVYFADMFDKSFAYAARGYAQQDSYLMLMCEVALGKSKELYNSEFIEKLDHPFHSVKGCGRRGPGYKHTVTCPNGVKIPLGKVINYHEKNPAMLKNLVLQHNEYIVYNTSQIRMRYLVQVKKKDLKRK